MEWRYFWDRNSKRSLDKVTKERFYDSYTTYRFSFSKNANYFMIPLIIALLVLLLSPQVAMILMLASASIIFWGVFQIEYYTLPESSMIGIALRKMAETRANSGEKLSDHEKRLLNWHYGVFYTYLTIELDKKINKDFKKAFKDLRSLSALIIRWLYFIDKKTFTDKVSQSFRELGDTMIDFDEHTFIEKEYLFKKGLNDNLPEHFKELDKQNEENKIVKWVKENQILVLLFVAIVEAFVAIITLLK